MSIGTIKFIDLKGVSLSSTEVVFDGIYEAIEGSIGRAVCLSNINIGGTDKGTAYVEFVVDSDDFVADVFGVRIRINDDDEVSVEALPAVLPTFPTAADTYELVLTVDASGEGTLAWSAT